MLVSLKRSQADGLSLNSSVVIEITARSIRKICAAFELVLQRLCQNITKITLKHLALFGVIQIVRASFHL